MEEQQLEIIYEDENLATVNKPYGVNFDWALNERSDLLPVHRLDKDTSGIILFAKNTVTAEYLKKLFREREIKKTYLTLVVGAVKDCEGKIELAIGRSKKTPLKRVAIGEQRGKIRHAVTGFKVLKKFASGHPTSAWMSDVQASFTLVEAYPKTGRTHQIRSHFAAIGHPVVCDKPDNFCTPPRWNLHCHQVDALSWRPTCRKIWKMLFSFYANIEYNQFADEYRPPQKA